MSKRCSTCGVDKPVSEFHKNRVTKDGFQNQCKGCRRHRGPENPEKKKVRYLKYYIRDREKRSIKAKERYLANREAIVEQQKISREKNLDSYLQYQRSYQKDRRVRDPNFALRGTLRSRIRSALKRSTTSPRSFSITEYVGRSVEEVRRHLESNFRPGWNWRNHGELWEIDHIVPLALFNLSDLEELKKACHYTNLQPLSIKEHRLKTRQDLKLIRQCR